MAGHRRGEGDETGRGVAGARHLSEPVDALRTAMDEPDWVAEDPEAHLLPHIRSGLKGGMRITRAEVSDEGELVVHLAVRSTPGSTGRRRSCAPSPSRSSAGSRSRAPSSRNG